MVMSSRELVVTVGELKESPLLRSLSIPVQWTSSKTAGQQLVFTLVQFSLCTLLAADIQSRLEPCTRLATVTPVSDCVAVPFVIAGPVCRRKQQELVSTALGTGDLSTCVRPAGAWRKSPKPSNMGPEQGDKGEALSHW